MAIQDDLNAAKRAYHDLVIGQNAEVIVDMNGERVEFTKAEASRLAAYIDSLTKEINGVTSSGGPLNVMF